MTTNFMDWIFTPVKKTYKEMSFDQVTAQIRDAVSAKLNPQSPNPYYSGPVSPSYWVSEVYPGYVIVVCSKDEGYYKVPYTMTGEEVTVSDQLIPVEKTWVEKQG
jgi:hypothetical protein